MRGFLFLKPFFQWVLSFTQKKKQRNVDVSKLREFYAGFQCNGVVSLIEYLVSPRAEGLMEIGSSSIGLGEIMNEIFLTEEARMASAWFRTKKLYIGSKDGSVTPLQWLEKLTEVFGHTSDNTRKRFDKICGDLALFGQAISVDWVDMDNGNGKVYRLPPGVYRPNMSDSELEQYRVPGMTSLFDDEDTPVRYNAPFENMSATKH